MDAKEARRRRKAMALRIAERIGAHFRLARTDYDTDEAARLVEQEIPLSSLEAEAEYDAAEPVDGDYPLPPPGPSLMDKLRSALGTDRRSSLTECIRSATEIVAKWRAEHRTDDDEPACFDWLAGQANRHEDEGHLDRPPTGEVWWEIGILSFTCDSYQDDPGEPFTAVADDWQVDGWTLPKALVPQTRGDFRRLLRALKITPDQESPR